jgi:hypothetical protein
VQKDIDFTTNPATASGAGDTTLVLALQVQVSYIKFFSFVTLADFVVKTWILSGIKSDGKVFIH